VEVSGQVKAPAILYPWKEDSAFGSRRLVGTYAALDSFGKKADVVFTRNLIITLCLSSL